MTRYFFLLLLLLPFSPVLAQTRSIDSLKAALAASSTEEQSLRTLLALCEEQYSMSTDSLEYYATKAASLAARLKNQHAASLANHRIAFCLMKRGRADTALRIVDRELEKNPVTSDKKRDLFFRYTMLKAQISNSQANAKESITALFGMLGLAEKYRDTAAAVQAMNGIGSVRNQMDQPSDALANFYSVLAYEKDPRFWRFFSSMYSNMAIAHDKLGHTDSALVYADKAITLCRKVGNLTFLANALSYQSGFYVKLKRVGEAEQSLRESIAVRTRMNDQLTFQNDQVRLATFYLTTGQAQKAVDVLLAALPGNNIPFMRLKVYEALAKGYRELGKSSEYQATLERIIELRDSVQQQDASAALAEMQTKYEVQKKENTIIQQELDISRKNYLVFGSLALLVFATVIALIIFFNYRKRQQLKITLMLQQEKDSAALAVLRAGESERKRIAADLHDNLGAYAASIVSNLEFIRPEKNDEGSHIAMQELRHNSLSIVSQLNDTIWVLNKDALSLTAISDRVKAFIKRVQPSFPLVQMQVTEDLEVDHLLPAAQAYQLFRIVQEAVNNALRHSGCRHTGILLASRDRWQVEISDDGSGMKPASGSMGNGLANMKARAAEAGWDVGWSAGRNGGTVVMITPLTGASDR